MTTSSDWTLQFLITNHVTRSTIPARHLLLAYFAQTLNVTKSCTYIVVFVTLSPLYSCIVFSHISAIKACSSVCFGFKHLLGAAPAPRGRDSCFTYYQDIVREAISKRCRAPKLPPLNPRLIGFRSEMCSGSW